jgi:hypothetical protein
MQERRSEMALFGKKRDDAGELEALGREAKKILATAFVNQGPLYSAEREQILRTWMENFIRNVAAGSSALATGRGMDTAGISKQQIGSGLQRMCDDYGRVDTMQRLEDVCGKKTRNAFAAVITKVRSIANRL